VRSAPPPHRSWKRLVLTFVACACLVAACSRSRATKPPDPPSWTYNHHGTIEISAEPWLRWAWWDEKDWRWSSKPPGELSETEALWTYFTPCAGPDRSRTAWYHAGKPAPRALTGDEELALAVPPPMIEYGQLEEHLKQGRWYRWHPNGQLESMQDYLYSLMGGAVVAWYPNGQMRWHGEGKLSTFVGHWTFWDEEGHVIVDGDRNRMDPWKYLRADGSIDTRYDPRRSVFDQRHPCKMPLIDDE